jgi:hypothetical protein
LSPNTPIGSGEPIQFSAVVSKPAPVRAKTKPPAGPSKLRAADQPVQQMAA